MEIDRFLLKEPFVLGVLGAKETNLAMKQNTIYLLLLISRSYKTSQSLLLERER